MSLTITIAVTTPNTLTYTMAEVRVRFFGNSVTVTEPMKPQDITNPN